MTYVHRARDVWVSYCDVKLGFPAGRRLEKLRLSPCLLPFRVNLLPVDHKITIFIDR
jgi:hypothetical protein